MILEIGVPKGFRLADAVMSYGWAVLAPNKWIRVTDSHHLSPYQSLSHQLSCLNIARNFLLRGKHDREKLETQAIISNETLSMQDPKSEPIDAEDAFLRPLHTSRGTIVKATIRSSHCNVEVDIRGNICAIDGLEIEHQVGAYP
jgi:hypothetical protein